MKKIFFTAMLITVGFMPAIYSQKKNTDTERQVWLKYMDRLAGPVLSNLANNTLKEKMPVTLSPATSESDRNYRGKVAYLEAFGRTLSGIAPWLNLEGGSKQEVELRNKYRQWSLRAIANATDPTAKDYLVWQGGQPLVDASFVALGLVRCPWLWNHLDTTVKRNVVNAFGLTRPTIPYYSNWILFSTMIEAFFCKYGYEYDPLRIEYGIREFANHWYVGDGMFSDGMNFHYDYYNSIVIHPYLANILDAVNDKTKSYDWFSKRLDTINKRYAVLQERMINTDGSYPITGRSIAYRGGVFHHLADITLRKKLPQQLSPGQVRSALGAVIRKTLESPLTFNENGWLNIGLYGKQPHIGESYITTGSLYLCMDIFLPLGLSETDEFWSSPAEPWTAVKAWQGRDVHTDHAMDLKQF